MAASLALSMAVGSADAQSYRCRGANGATTLSDRPCASTSWGYIGPLRGAEPSYAGAAYATPRPGAMAEHFDLLSAHCKDLSEAIRTGPSRGLRGEAMSGLRNEWQASRCDEDEAHARRRLQEQRGEARKARDADRESARAAADASQRKREQCDQQQQVLGERYRRPGLTDAERADLKRYIDSHRERCLLG